MAILSVKELQTPFTSFDEGLAASNLTLAAYAHGVGSCVLGSVDVQSLRVLLNIDDTLDVSCVIGFGYPVHESAVVDADGDDLKYYMDENANYVVPKRKIEDTVTDI